MKTVQIRSCFPQDVTILSNEFLDRFMPQANGEFVKIYLYLLRASQSTALHLELSRIADALNCTDMDVQRALRYWEKTGVLRIRENADGEIEELTFVNFCNPDVWTQEDAPAPAASEAPKKIQITAAERNTLSAQEEVSQLFFIAEQYLGRTLTKTDSDTILYLYSKCAFSVDLIDYLIEYCVSIGHKGIHYIREVAFAWQEAGITTVAAAKARTADFQKEVSLVFRALGIKNHSVTEAEKNFIDRWFFEYKFPDEIVEEACKRTILTTGKPSFQYAESILHAWHEKNVQSLADIARLDQTHGASAKKSPAKGGAGRFDFGAQRKYDFEKLEAQLLNKGKRE